MDNMMRKSQMETKDLLLLESEVKSQGKNMVVAYVLWYFLGMLGGHRFYMGKTGSAIAQLILTITVIGSIATFIWWIVDAFKLHQWVKEHNSAIENRIMDQITLNKINRPAASVQY
jgi:TM2 domain-containing membrane protein YozV